MTQPDSIVPEPGNPQAWNRYSYALNNPLRYTDPTGHKPIIDEDKNGNPIVDPFWRPNRNGNRGNERGREGGNGDWGCSSTTSNGQLSIHCQVGTHTCDATCQAWVTGLGIGGTALDTFALGMNLTWAVIVYGSVIFAPEATLPLEAAYKLVSPIPNFIGTAGGALWAAQGVVLGETQVQAGLTLNIGSQTSLEEVHYSTFVSQDTYVAAVLDSLGWMAPEPLSASGVSLFGVSYDIMRNPLSPSLSSASPIIPTIINPNFSFSYNFTGQSGTYYMSPFHL